jgi:hypothetical protein
VPGKPKPKNAKSFRKRWMLFASYCPVFNLEINDYQLAVEAPAC